MICEDAWIQCFVLGVPHILNVSGLLFLLKCVVTIIDEAVATIYVAIHVLKKDNKNRLTAVIAAV